jgi:zinc protease
VLVGDLPESGELRGRVEDAFGRWRGERVEPVELKDPADPTSRRLWGIEWAGPQSEIRVGGIGIARRDPEYAAVQLMNAILGGLFSSRINMNLREDKGWTYGAASRLDSRKRRGPFYVGTAVDARASVDAVREILNEMERMKEEPATSDELQLAKNAITLSLPRLFETVSQVSGRIAHQVVYDLPDDYWERYGDTVRQVGPQDVQRAAGRLLQTDRATIVIVGPLADFLDELTELGPFERRDIRGDLVS